MTPSHTSVLFKMPFLPRMMSQAKDRTTTPVSSGNTAAIISRLFSRPGDFATTWADAEADEQRDRRRGQRYLQASPQDVAPKPAAEEGEIWSKDALVVAEGRADGCRHRQDKDQHNQQDCRRCKPPAKVTLFTIVVPFVSQCPAMSSAYGGAGDDTATARFRGPITCRTLHSSGRSIRSWRRSSWDNRPS